MKTVLITGSSGFLGSEISKLAVASGYKVIGADVKYPSSFPDKNFSFERINLSDSDFKTSSRPELIIHTASSLPFGGSKSNFYSNNILAARNIALFADKVDAFLVEIGSSSVYGRPAYTPIDENTPLRPIDAYAKSKLQAELEIAKCLPTNQFSVIRPRTILGSGRGGIFEIFFSIIKKRMPIPLPNKGQQVIQFTHVQDLARLSLFIGEGNISGTWPAASPFPKSLFEHLRDLQSEANFPIRYISVNPRLFYSVGFLAYHARLTKFTPWHFGAFPYDSYFAKEWKPNNFEYIHSCSEAFLATWRSHSMKFPRQPRIFARLGRQI